MENARTSSEKHMYRTEPRIYCPENTAESEEPVRRMRLRNTIILLTPVKIFVNVGKR
jgi:hypothetical protein